MTKQRKAGFPPIKDAATRPLCRCCGKPIPRRSRVAFFDYEEFITLDQIKSAGTHGNFTYGRPVPANAMITRAGYHSYHGPAEPGSNRPGPIDPERGDSPYVQQVHYWVPGEYTDSLFCKDACAAAVGRAAVVRGNWTTKAWLAAEQKRGASLLSLVANPADVANARP